MICGVRDNASLGLSQLVDLTDSTNDNSSQGQYMLSQIKIDQIEERIAELRSTLMASCQQSLQDIQVSLTNYAEESKSECDHFILIAEKYNQVDKAFLAMLKEEQRRLELLGIKVDIPPMFKATQTVVKQLGYHGLKDKDADSVSMYVLQTGYFGYTARTICKLISVGSSTKPDGQKNELKVIIKMHGGAYVYAHRLGAYHSNLAMDIFFKFAVSKTQKNAT